MAGGRAEAPSCPEWNMTPTHPCPRCARELPPTANACEHCGPDPADALDLASFFDDLRDRALDAVQATEQATRPSMTAAPGGADDPAQDHSGPAAAAAAHDLQDAVPAATDSAAIVGAAGASGGAVAQQAARRGISRAEIATISVGVFGGAVLFLALLSARGSAAPEAAAPAESATRPGVAAAPVADRGSAAPERLPDVEPSWIPNPEWVGRARQSVAFELAARNEVQVWLRKVRPVLIVRCMSRNTEAFVFTDSAAKMEPQDEDHSVRVRFDDEPESTERWPDSQEHDALFARDGAVFARRLLQARTLQFGFTPHNADPVVARFDVAGLASLLEPAAKQCGWNRK